MVDSAAVKSPDTLPDDTVVEGDSRILEQLFGINQVKILRPEIITSFSNYPNTTEANLRTFREISRSIYCICKKIIAPSIDGVVFVGNGPMRYRPVISYAKEQYNRIITCQLLLIS